MGGGRWDPHIHTHKQRTRYARNFLVGAGLSATGPDPAQGRPKAGKGCVFVCGTFMESLVLIKAD